MSPGAPTRSPNNPAPASIHQQRAASNLHHQPTFTTTSQFHYHQLQTINHLSDTHQQSSQHIALSKTPATIPVRVSTKVVKKAAVLSAASRSLACTPSSVSTLFASTESRTESISDSTPAHGHSQPTFSSNRKLPLSGCPHSARKWQQQARKDPRQNIIIISSRGTSSKDKS